MAKKSKTEGKAEISTAATTHGHEAFGARYAKKGLTFSPAHDLEFALGWPHMFELAEGHPDDADPAASALRICNAMASGSVWGLKTAHKLARGWAVEGATDVHGKPLRAFVEATSKDGPVSPDEAHSLVSQTIRTRAVHNLRHLMLVCEAIVGPDATVKGALEGLAATPPEIVWGHSTNRAHRPALVALGLMLLRLRPEGRDAALATWQKLYNQWKSEAPS